MDIGEQMLVCGAEVHRVEDSIARMCRAFGAKRIDVFIITSSMVVTIFDEDGESFTQTRRINGSGTDIEKLHLLNQLSRKICSETMTVEEIQKELSNCKESKPYPFWLVSISYAMIAAAFTVFFGGTSRELLFSPIIGFVTSLMVYFSEQMKMNKILEKFLCSFLVTAIAFLFVRIGAIDKVDYVIIGNIMTLIPGIGLTNALRDLLVGDSIAGLLRSVEAALMALAIGAGYFLFVWMGGVLI
jgi:uncharacterized membrane protein YjjP (DUF1212 family)